MLAFPLSLDSAVQVRAESLVPKQQSVSRRARISANYSCCELLKHTGLSEFLTVVTYLYAGLLEGDPEVHTFVPRPFHLRISGKRFTPNFFVRRANSADVVVISRRGTLPESQRVPLESFLTLKNMRLRLLNYDAILNRSTEAQNWLSIVHTLILCSDIATEHQEADVYSRLHTTYGGFLTLRDFVDFTDRAHTFLTELSLFRLLHRGQLLADLSQPLSERTTLCMSPGVNVL